MYGEQRIGRYEVLGHLASGGMGQVYLARATGLGGFERQVVVKTLDRSSFDEDDAFVTMFLDEARLVGALHHQYIAPVYEVGCDDNGCYFLVMDYVHGETAEAVFRVASERRQVVPLAFALTVGSCVASALDYAHTLCAADGTPLDIVHRDVSLTNVMCGHDGAVKLIDFGIAKAANRATRTQVGTLKGKIGYLAPEQIHRGQLVDHRADIFALGILLYELTTGTRAFLDASDLITLERITAGEFARPSEVVAGYPAELERIVMKAMRVDPARRYQSARAMGRDLEAYAAARAIPLGHAAVAETMGVMFSERGGRRRLARGSAEVQTDPEHTGAHAIARVPDTLDGTTTVDPRPDAYDAIDPDTERSAHGSVARARAADTARPPLGTPRAQRPTTPLGDRKRPPPPAHDPDAIETRRFPTSPLDVLEAPDDFDGRPTHRIPTGPPLPVPAPVAGDLSGAVTNLVGGRLGPQAHEATVSVVGRTYGRSDARAMRTWLWLCVLFGAAVAMAIVVASL